MHPGARSAEVKSGRSAERRGVPEHGSLMEKKVGAQSADDKMARSAER